MIVAGIGSGNSTPKFGIVTALVQQIINTNSTKFMSLNYGPKSHIWPFFGALLLLVSVTLFFHSEWAEREGGIIPQSPKHGPMTPAQGYATSALAAV